MALTLIPINGAITSHTGSTAKGAVAGTVASTQTFVLIDGVAMIQKGDIMTTPSHINDYDSEGDPTYHSHTQPITVSLQSFLTIESVAVAQIGDNSGSDLTEIVSSGQTFVY
jgi:uncharacterized Zn-binding protein involved in type VI secretion